MAHIKEERLTLLLAVVGNVDAGGDLLRHHLPHRRLALSVKLRGIDGLATRAAHIKRCQRRRTRQAAGVRRQNAILATQHRGFPYTAIACSNTPV